MIKEVDGVISGNIRSPSGSISGDITGKALNLQGTADVVGQRIVYDAQWGGIKGDIDRQEDLQVELHERDNSALTVQEIEKILYLGR